MVKVAALVSFLIKPQIKVISLSSTPFFRLLMIVNTAAAALHAMNGVQLGSKQIIVRLHEPRQLRQEKLAQRFSGHNGHPRSSSGATSPTLSEGGESMGGWGSPRQRSVTLGSPHEKERGRRGSGSYYNVSSMFMNVIVCLISVRLLSTAPSISPCVMMTYRALPQLYAKRY